MIAEVSDASATAVNWLEHIPAVSIVALFQGLILVELIRRRKLLEPYAIVWVIFTVFFFFIGLVPHVLLWLAEVTGIFYLTLLVLIGGFFFICVLLQYSLILSSHSKSVMDLSRACALLKNRIDQLEKTAAETKPDDDKKIDA